MLDLFTEAEVKAAIDDLPEQFRLAVLPRRRGGLLLQGDRRDPRHPDRHRDEPPPSGKKGAGEAVARFPCPTGSPRARSRPADHGCDPLRPQLRRALEIYHLLHGELPTASAQDRRAPRRVRPVPRERTTSRPSSAGSVASAPRRGAGARGIDRGRSSTPHDCGSCSDNGRPSGAALRSQPCSRRPCWHYWIGVSLFVSVASSSPSASRTSLRSCARQVPAYGGAATDA